MMAFDAEHYLRGVEQLARDAERHVRNWAYADDGTDVQLKAAVRRVLQKAPPTASPKASA